MPITFDWYDQDNGIILMTFDKRWTWNEAYEVHQQVVDVLGESDTIVDSILNLEGTSNIPPDAVVHGRRFMKKLDPRQGMSVYVKPPTMLKMMFNMAEKIMPDVMAEADFAIANTVEEAAQIILERRNPRTSV